MSNLLLEVDSLSDTSAVHGLRAQSLNHGWYTSGSASRRTGVGASDGCRHTADGTLRTEDNTLDLSGLHPLIDLGGVRVHSVVSLQCNHLGVEVVILLLQGSDIHVSATDILDSGSKKMVGLLDQVEDTTMFTDDSGSKRLDLCIFVHASNLRIDTGEVLVVCTVLRVKDKIHEETNVFMNSSRVMGVATTVS